jgi:hypothetical protein
MSEHSLPRVAGRLTVTLIGTLLVVALGAIVALLNSLVWSSLRGGMFCPDGGDERWSKVGPVEYAIWLLTGLLIAWLVWLAIRGMFRRSRVVTRPKLSAALVAGTSAGSVTAFAIVWQVFDQWNTPSTYRCGDSYPGVHMPDAVMPALGLLFLIALGAVFGASFLRAAQRG